MSIRFGAFLVAPEGEVGGERSVLDAVVARAEVERGNEDGAACGGEEHADGNGDGAEGELHCGCLSVCFDRRGFGLFAEECG